jgi:protein involved in polysaccharide export with SLBB domain
VPYAEHILTAHLVDLDGADATQALVCTWSMSAQKWTSAARLRPGDRVKLKVRAWSDVSAQYEKINRSELSDAALQLEEPVWGEIVER